MSNFTFIVTGSEGWISKNFIDIIEKFFDDCSVYKINRNNPLENINKLEEKENIILIHNIFTRAEKLEDPTTHDNFISESINNFKYIEKFINNSDTRGLFYPSSGSIYKFREKDKKNYLLYSDRKLEEEKLFAEICEKNKINYMISRIFSSIGPHMNNPDKFPIGSFTKQAASNKKIEIFSETNNSYSFCYLEVLCELVLKTLTSSKNGINYVFDPVNVNLSLLDIAKLVSEKFNLDKNIEYKFNNSELEENYLGNPETYNALLKEYQIETKSTDYYLTKNIEYIKNTYVS